MGGGVGGGEETLKSGQASREQREATIPMPSLRSQFTHFLQSESIIWVRMIGKARMYEFSMSFLYFVTRKFFH